MKIKSQNTNLPLILTMWRIQAFLCVSCKHTVVLVTHMSNLPTRKYFMKILITMSRDFDYLSVETYETPHDKTNKMTVRPAKTQISLGIRSVWSESSLCAHWVAKDLTFLHADCEDSYNTGRMPRLIWIFVKRTYHFAGFVMRWLICGYLVYWLEKQYINLKLFLVRCTDLLWFNESGHIQYMRVVSGWFSYWAKF